MEPTPKPEKRSVRTLRVVGGSLCLLGFAADLLGIGGGPGLGEWQTVLVLVGLILIASTFLAPRGPAVPREPGAARRRSFRGAYSTFAVLLLNTVLGFVLLNAVIGAGFALTDAAGWTRAQDLGIDSPLRRLPMVRLAQTATGGPLKHDLPTLALDDARLAQVYPGWSRGPVKEMLRESWGRPLRFNPYTEFQEKPFRGRYFNILEPGYRLVRDPGPWPLAPGVRNVWVFGGSTTFGYGVADWQTIPSFLQESLRRRSSGAPVRVYNFGQGYFYSSQEVALFRSLLAAGGTTPELAIFIDGINEPQREPYFSGYMRGLIRSPEMAFLFRPKVASFPRGEDVVERWLRNKRMIEGICASFRIEPLFVWQPAPDWKYDLRNHLFWWGRGKEPPGTGPVYGDAPHYAAMERVRARNPERLGRDFFWLGDLQQGARKPLYVDRLHYTAELNHEIAESIARRVQPGS